MNIRAFSWKLSEMFLEESHDSLLRNIIWRIPEESQENLWEKRRHYWNKKLKKSGSIRKSHKGIYGKISEECPETSQRDVQKNPCSYFR